MDATFEGENPDDLKADLADRQQWATDLLSDGFYREEVTLLYGFDALPPLTQGPK